MRGIATGLVGVIPGGRGATIALVLIIPALAAGLTYVLEMLLLSVIAADCRVTGLLLLIRALA